MVVVDGPTLNVNKLQILIIQLTLYVLDALDMEQSEIKVSVEIKMVIHITLSRKSSVKFIIDKEEKAVRHEVQPGQFEKKQARSTNQEENHC